MANNDALAMLRATYARQTLDKVRIKDAPALEAAFATVRREDFLGPGPWQVMRFGKGYEPTPSADPAHLYTDDLFGLIPERGLNNGQPSLHAFLLKEAAIQPGDHVVHVGTGVGYYTALMAHLAGAAGRITGIEYDPGLAARAAANFAQWRNVEIKQGDGATVPFAPADVIYVNAGATRPADRWLDGLNEGGRLVLPLTVNRTAGSDGPMTMAHVGAMLLVTRRGGDYPVRWLSPVAIFPCAGNRDPAAEQVLADALGRPEARTIARLIRGPHPKEDRCIAHGDGWCLAR